MSNEEQKSSAALEKITAVAGKAGRALWGLKQSNPKVFFGGVGGVAVGLILLMLSGKSGVMQEPKVKELVPGQTYTLKNPNSFGDNAATELVTTPGNTAAFDNSEESDTIVCKAANGTRVKLKNFADAFGKRNLYAEVEVQSGECAGKIGWTTVVNIEE